jgi:hypothetical protein
MGNYDELSKSALNFAGFNGINWNVTPVSSSEYYVELSNVDSALCTGLEFNPGGAKRAEINGGSGCKNSNNTIRLFY